MTPLRLFAAVSCVAVLSGCAANRHCAGPQNYESAVSIPVLVAADGLRMPVSATALKVPEAKGAGLGFGYEVPDPKRPGKTQTECLDSPPPLTDAANAK